MAIKSLEEINAPQDRIIGAFDQDSWAEARAGMAEYGSYIGLGKTNSLCDELGVPATVKELAKFNLLSMIDLKVYDIDDTNRRRTRVATSAGASMVTLHASNSTKALKDAVKGVEEAMALDSTLAKPWLLGVTVLTSIRDDGEETCESIFGGDRMTKVRQFAHKAADAGFDGVVCSPQEAEMVRDDKYTEHMKLVLPAIRPVYAVKPDEQATATTPKIAIEAGGDFLVVGRPLIKSYDYHLTGIEAAQIIAQEIAEAA